VRRPATVLAGCVLALALAAAVPARSQSCSDMDVDAAASRAGELTTLLKIANFRGDVKYMGEVALELEQFLATCGDEAAGPLPLVCDFDCHLQLGRYRLFMAAELPFLSSASGVSRNDTPLSPQGAQEIGRQGLEVVERGLRILARQQGGGGNAAEEEASYRNFVRQLVALSALKIQLLMNTGDVWYQTVSEARVKQLDFLITRALDAGGGAGLAGQPNLAKAYTNYEAALWTLVETQMDVPGESTYDDLRADLLLLEHDLQARVDSVKKGYLFLGIDPLQFTTIPFEELQQRLAETERNLESIEGRVEAIVERWHANKAGEATRALDEQRTIRSQQVNLVAHRIGKLEHEAQIFANGVQQQINAVDAERDTFGFRQQIRTLEIQLATKIAEFDNQRRQLEDRRELDLIVLSKEAEIERRNELRWLLSFEMTQMNLDLQISSLESQVTEYQRQLDRNANQREQLVRQRQILQTQIASAQNGIQQALANIQQTEIRQQDIYGKRRAVIREDACSIETQLAFIGEAPASPFAPGAPGEQACSLPTPSLTRNQYLSRMCGTATEVGLREELNREQIRARAFVLQCVVGSTDFSDLTPMVGKDPIIVDGSADNPTLPGGVTVDCGRFTQTQTEFAKQVWEAERAAIDQQASNLQEQMEEINGQIKFIEDWVGGFLATIQYLQVGVQAAEALFLALTSIPKTTVAAAGMASGVYSTINIDGPAAAALNSLKNVLDITLKVGKIEIETEIQIRALGRQLTLARQANEQIDFTKALKAAALNRVHFQLAGERAEGANAIKELTLRSSLAALDCDNDEAGLADQVARLRAEHARVLASLDLQASENDLLSFDVAAQQRQIERYDNEIAILTLELDKVALTDQQLNDDSASIGELVSAAQGRLQRVRTAQTTVNGLAAESNASTNLINELRDRQQRKMLALSDAELAFVERRITAERGNTETLVQGLGQAIDLGLKSRQLQAGILTFQGEIQAQVSKQQEELTALVSQIDDPAQRRNLFIANQETLAELMKGIPEYLVTKRRNLEVSNQLLHLMRRRFAIVHAVTGGEAPGPSTYVRNATQLDALVDNIVNKRFFDERQINIDVAQVVIPANSGFVRKLALTEAVEFEVSPFAGTEASMRQNGFFTLWAPNKFRDRRNMTLIDVFFGTQYQCTGAQWNRFALSHQGSGFVFRPLAEGSREVAANLSVGPERLSLQTFFNLADSQDEVNRIIRYWVQDRFQVRRFPRSVGPPNDTTSVLPFLGAPVMGSYRLSLQPSDCPFDGAVFTAYFIFASAP
jgi:hypothetical protein